MKTVFAVGIVAAGCFVIWLLGKIVEKITGIPVWGDSSSGGGVPKP